MSTFEIVMRILEHPHYRQLRQFIEDFVRHYADSGGLGLQGDGGKIEFTHKQSSVHYPNDLVAQVPDRRSRARARRHAPRPIEIIFGASTLSEQESIWRCHVLPRLPPAFQELFLMRITDPAQVPNPLWCAFEDTVLYPLLRVLDGRRNSSMVKNQFADHLWKIDADWTWIRTDWLLHTKKVAFEGPTDALWMHMVGLFQVDKEIVNTILTFPEGAQGHLVYAFLDLPLSSRRNKTFMAKFFKLAGSASFLRTLQHPLFHVGANARTGICASSAVATAGERKRIVELGERAGCHHCGHTHPQPKWSALLNYWILDHQPPRSKRLASSMGQGQFLVGPIFSDDLVYMVGLGDDTLAGDELTKAAGKCFFETRDGKSVALLPYVQQTKKALLAYLTRLGDYFTQHDGKFRFYLHCHDCAGLQGGLMQNLVKLAEELSGLRKRIQAKTARLREHVYFLQCLAQLHDVLDECFDPKRPLLRLDPKCGLPSIAASRSSGTREQRAELVALADRGGGGGQANSALGLENRLVLHHGAATCHSCKANVPVPRSLWTADHVAPSVLVEMGLRTGPQILYPQCVYCRKAQSVLAAAFKRVWLAADSAEAWDQGWSKVIQGGIPVGATGGASSSTATGSDDTSGTWIDPLQDDEDDELFDDIDPDADGDADLPPLLPPVTPGAAACVTAGIGRLSCLAQPNNTCGQRAAYNAAMMRAHEGNDGALAAALINDAALRAIGPMHVDIADNTLRTLLDNQGGQQIAMLSTLQQVRNVVADASMCIDDGDRALRAFALGTAARAYVVINTLANGVALPSLAEPAKGPAKIGHYIALRLSRAPSSAVVVNYVDSLADGASRDSLIQALIVALNGG